MTSEEAKSAVGKSISFRPYSVYTDALAFGRLQTPPRSISAVVCEALEFYLREKGFRAATQRQLAEVISTAEALGVERALRMLKKAAGRSKPRRRGR